MPAATPPDEAAVIRRHYRTARHAARRRAEFAARYGLDVDDLTQLGLLAILRAWREYDPACGVSFAHVAWKRCRDALRIKLGRYSNPRRSGVLTQEAATPVPLAELADRSGSEQDAADACEVVERLLKELTAEQRQTVELLYGLNGNERLSPDEVAQRLGIARGSIFYRQRMAFRAMAAAAKERGLG